MALPECILIILQAWFRALMEMAPLSKKSNKMISWFMININMMRNNENFDDSRNDGDEKKLQLGNAERRKGNLA